VAKPMISEVLTKAGELKTKKEKITILGLTIHYL